MNSKFYCTILFIAASIGALAQTGTISGTITTFDGRPAESVNITVKGTNRGARADGSGNYQITNVQEGIHVVVASFIGLEAQEKTVTVRPGESAVANFVLKENAAQLREVIVSAQQSPNRNTEVAKIPLKNLENPQVYNSVSAELLKQQVVTSYDDAFRNVPGITRTWESTGRAGDGAAYFALRGFDAQPSLTNGLPGLASGNLDPANVAEIQVIKGPSATLFGGSFYSYGGLINTITKKPYDGFGGEVTYSFGSFGLNRIAADINTPLSKTEKITARVNTAYHSEGSFQDAGFKKSFFIAPTLAYEVNDRLSFNIMAEILEEERAVAPVFFNSDRLSPLDFRTIEELNLNPSLSFTSNDITIKNPKYNLQAQMLYKLSDQWTSQTVVSRGTVKSNGYYSYLWDDVAGDNYFSQIFHKEQQTTNTTDIQQNFNGDFKIGNLRNRLLIGLDYYSRNVIDNGSGWGWARSVTPQGEVDYVDPLIGEEMPPVYLTQASIENLLGGLEGTMSNIANSSYSAYFSNVLNVTPGIMAMVSLRADYFDSKGEKQVADDDFDQFALSPKFGLVYQPIRDKISLFANYMNAFINVDPQQVFDVDGNFVEIKSFKPEQANQWEYGVKANLFSDKLFGTVSVYDIKVSDRVYPDPANPNSSVQGGKVGSKGFEVDVNANPVSGLNIMAGYSYNETKVITGNNDDFYSEPGRSPGGQGPQNLANIWATYRFPEGKLKYYGIGIGGNYASRYKVIDNSQTGVFYLPEYTLVNASVFYNGDHVRITANLNNLANTQYYTGYWSVNPQKKRNFAASVAYKF
ncbi:TonB-dependent receptor [Parapedobacter koreensis]|uniref:Iron complex outermembrane recepter protein n=1 Tax=Parapedobacter koreensis TaxID=332977 RepID=A0A1H7IWE4_9SPHI|nr:TonB-dependent receptor [Parapedobacter koreensis]SEK66564.1 iron complex outermembrane recepter protein [Parapedobacter koreensis]